MSIEAKFSHWNADNVNLLRYQSLYDYIVKIWPLASIFLEIVNTCITNNIYTLILCGDGSW